MVVSIVPEEVSRAHAIFERHPDENKRLEALVELANLGEIDFVGRITENINYNERTREVAGALYIMGLVKIGMVDSLCDTEFSMDSNEHFTGLPSPIPKRIISILDEIRSTHGKTPGPISENAEHMLDCVLGPLREKLKTNPIQGDGILSRRTVFRPLEIGTLKELEPPPGPRNKGKRPEPVR